MTVVCSTWNCSQFHFILFSVLRVICNYNIIFHSPFDMRCHCIQSKNHHKPDSTVDVIVVVILFNVHSHSFFRNSRDSLNFPFFCLSLQFHSIRKLRVVGSVFLVERLHGRVPFKRETESAEKYFAKHLNENCYQKQINRFSHGINWTELVNGLRFFVVVFVCVWAWGIPFSIYDDACGHALCHGIGDEPTWIQLQSENSPFLSFFHHSTCPGKNRKMNSFCSFASL